MSKYFGSNADVKRIARITLPGYPREGEFQTKEEVESYFSGNRIQCLLCGKWYKQLGIHLSRIHDVHVDEYREMYGLPWSRGLSCRDTKELRGRLARQLRREGKFTPHNEYDPLKKRKPKRHIQPYDLDSKKRHMAAVKSMIPNYTREDFEKIVDRMRQQQRSMYDVCGDPDLPGIRSCSKFRTRHPEFEEEIQQAYFSMPYSLQVKYNNISPRFIEECQRLRNRKMTMGQIGETLGVTSGSVRKALLMARESLNPGEINNVGIPPASKKRSWPLGMVKPGKWRREHYEAIVDRVRRRQRSLADVLRDPDLPSQNTWSLYVKKHPEFKEKLQRAYFSMPYSLQIKYENVSPRFVHDCQRLRARGLSIKKCAEAMGVAYASVRRRLWEALSEEERKLKTTRKRNRTSRGNRPPAEAFRPGKWLRKDYEAIVHRMREQQRGAFDVCGDPDLPSFSCLDNYRKRHPGFREKILQAYYSMPYSLQVKYRHPSPNLLADCRSRFDRGMNVEDIADALQIPVFTIRRLLKKTVEKKALVERAAKNRAAKWTREDYEAIPDRMWRQQRAISDVCGDSDLPAYNSWMQYAEGRPELKEKIRLISHRLPYSLQIASKRPSPRFRIDCKRLYARGLFLAHIAKALGVPLTSVHRVLRKSDDDRPGVLK